MKSVQEIAFIFSVSLSGYVLLLKGCRMEAVAAALRQAYPSASSPFGKLWVTDQNPIIVPASTS